jgi:hypothetical protein
MKSVVPNQITDERGIISIISDDKVFNNIAFITSKAGSQRANHVHVNDYHLCVLAVGRMNYYERPAFSQVKPTMVEIKSGEMFFIDPQNEHLMEFLEDSYLWCFSKNTTKEMDTINLPHNLAEIYKSMP